MEKEKTREGKNRGRSEAKIERVGQKQTKFVFMNLVYCGVVAFFISYDKVSGFEGTRKSQWRGRKPTTCDRNKSCFITLFNRC